MALAKGEPIKCSPIGVTDVLDGTQAAAGSMMALTNLIQDPSTRGVFYCRPAAIISTNFSGFSSPGFISAFEVIGSFAYGMIGSARNPGHDEPFVYNIAGGVFIAISGVTSANTPTSPASSGAWTPPTIALIGTKVIVTHPGFTGVGGNFFGWFDITNPAAPIWNAGNTSTNPLSLPPTCVAQFGNRAYYGVGNSVVYSDVLLPLSVTNANQVLTIGDNVAVTAMGPLGVYSSVQGGIVQALIVFKSVESMWQITGDAALSNLALNGLNVATGTLAPNTVCPTPKGLMFVSPEGLRVVDNMANVSDPIGAYGTGIAVPFINSVVPSRMTAAFNGNILRITTQNGVVVGQPQQEYWYNLTLDSWSGPHTFPASLIDAYLGTFIMAPVGVTGSLWQSDQVQNGTSTFTENGTPLTWNWQTSYLPDNEVMSVNAVVETTIRMGFDASIGTYSLYAIDQNGQTLDSVTNVAAGSSTIWGAFIWGSALWRGTATALQPIQIDWHIPIVFNTLSIRATGASASSLKIGNLFMRYQIQAYLLSNT